jgi:hypothetical protein
MVSERFEPDWRYVQNVVEITERLGEIFVNGVSVGKGALCSVEDVFRIERAPGSEVVECGREEYSAAEEIIYVE